MATWISRHRKAGCDCRDADIYVPDDLVFNPLFAQGCAADAKPPCKYLIKFECNSYDALDPSHLIFETSIPLRQVCEFNDTPGRYVALMFSGIGGSGIPFQSFNAAELASTVPYGCSWLNRYPGYTQSVLMGYARWVLDTVGTVRLSHPNGIVYELPSGVAWDCFGPNTLRLVSGETGSQGGLQQYVCIVPEIQRYTPADGCCQNGYETTLPAIQAGDSYFMPQRIEFMPIRPEDLDYNPQFACQYKAFVKLYASTTDGFSGNVTTCFYGQSDLSGQFGSQLTTARLLTISQTGSGVASHAILKLSYLPSCSGSPVEVIYDADSLSCDGCTFNRSTNDQDFPLTITLTYRKPFYEEVNDAGMTYNCPGGGYMKDPNRPTYSDEYNRYHCCDPWGQSAPGKITIYCPSRGTQTISGCYETGGHTGLNSPAGPSRELCGTFTATDGTTHTICCVAYCSDGAWRTDWYCDGSYAGAGSGGSVSCCPHEMTQNMPSISCLPGCSGCMALGIGVETDCHPVVPACCDPGDEPGTLHVTFTSSCASLNGTSVLLTRTGAGQWELTTMGPVYLLRCVSGTWTLTITYSAGTPCTITLTSTNPVCKPIMAGTFGTVTTTCVAGLCGIGTTVSAELSP